MSSFKRKKLRVGFQFLLVPGLSKRRECPGMSPSRGKYLACWSHEGATLKKRKEMRDPLICLSTRLWRCKKCSYPTYTTLNLLRCVCLCVCADNSSACVCEEWTAEQRVQVDCCLLWTWLFPFTHLCEKYSTTLFNLSGNLLSRHTAAINKVPHIHTVKHTGTWELPSITTASFCGPQQKYVFTDVRKDHW